jgi:hypothetical protein
MPSNFLQIIQTACDELGLNRPSVVINSTDLQIRQLAAVCKRDLRELQQNYDWTALQAEFDLYVSRPLTVAGDVTTGSFYITNVTQNLTTHIDFNGDFNTDFGGQGLNAGNAQLFVVNGGYIPVNTRIVSVTWTGSSYTFLLDQAATGNATQEAIVIAQDTYPGPADFDRYINQTWWDRTNRWALLGPDSPQVDQWHRSGIVTIGPRRHFRQIGYNGLTTTAGPVNNYRLWPPPSATDTPIQLAYEYISVNCVLSANGTPQPTFLADTDIPILDENMLILGAKWRLWQIKGFDYAAMQEEYIDYVERKYANDGAAKTLSLPGNRAGIYSSLVQDGNFPGPSSSGV